MRGDAPRTFAAWVTEPRRSARERGYRTAVRASLAAVLLAAVPLVTRAAPAATPGVPGPADQGFVLSVRGGWATPVGELTGEGDPPLDAVVRSRTPLGLEVGYRLDRRLWLGLFLEFAPTRVHRTYCLTSCEGEAVRFGASLQLHLSPRGSLDPWVGAGLALEFLTLEASVDLDGDGQGDVDRELQYAGLSVPLQAGLDLVLASRLRLGPYLAVSPGQYTSVQQKGPGASGARTRVEDRATHAWLELGLRVALLL